MTSPASNITTTAGFNHLKTVFYSKTALDSLREKQSFWRLIDENAVKALPKGEGTTVQFYRNTNMGAPSTPTATTEGTVGTGLTRATSKLTATVSQYADWGSVSDMLADTSLSGEAADLADQLGYRAAVVTNNINKNEIDSAASSIDLSGLDDKFTARDATHVAHLLEGLNIRPLRDGLFEALIHPYVSFDLISDPQAGGFQDMVKHDTASMGNNRLFAKEDRNFVAQISGVRFWSATDVTATGATPNAWRVYFAGKGGVGAIDLSGRGPQRVADHEVTPFGVNVFTPGLSAADPAGKIRTYVSYNFVYVAKLLDTTNYRLRKIDATSGIVS